jgi:hypothetical protein
MTPLYIAAAVAVVAAVLFLRLRADDLRVADLPRAVADLRLPRHDGAFLYVVFTPADADRACVGLQFWRDGGRLVLDWDLTPDGNTADAALVERFLRDRGQPIQHVEVNGLRSLRVEHADVGVLGAALLRELHGATDGDRLVTARGRLRRDRRVTAG